MQVKALVVQDRDEVWFKGSRDERAQRILTIMDADLEAPMPASMDYRLTPDEAKQFAKGQLNGQTVTILVSDLAPSKGGRFVLKGRIASNGHSSLKPTGKGV